MADVAQSIALAPAVPAAAPASTTVAVNRNPFPGLRPFRPEEEHLFFGRESQVDRMVDKLAARRFLAVVGPSGSGKSSLVNCGLRPALHRGYMASAGAAWRMAQFRPGSDPIGALAHALAAPGVLFEADDADGDDALPLHELVEATLRLGSLGLVDIVEQARLPAGVNLLVVADQFEELFRFRALSRRGAQAEFGLAEDALAFVKLLLEAVAQSALPIYVVLTMRSDFLGECAQFHGLPEVINESQYLVPRLTREEIRAAVTGPVSVARAAITPVLLTRLLNDVGDNPDQLSILQHALNRTWAYWEDLEGVDPATRAEIPKALRAPLDLPHYLAIGGMQQALDQHAEKAYGELADDRERRICEFVFRALTDKGTDPRGVRRPTRLAQLCAITGAERAEVIAVMERFRKPSRSFLMPPQGETLGDDSVIDISHESLMRVWRRLAGWTDEEAESARVYRRVGETAALHAAGRAGLWRDPDLSLALDWRTRDQPTAAWAAQYAGDHETAMRFLDESRDAVAKEKLEAEIDRRWQAGWNLMPIVLVAVPFIFLQPRTAEWLNQSIASYLVVGETRLIPIVAQPLSHLLTGIPALLGYMLIALYAKRLFRDLVRRSLVRQVAAAGGGVGAVIEREERRKTILAIDVHRTAYSGFWRRTGAHLLDWGVCAGLVAVAVIVYAIGLALLKGALEGMRVELAPPPEAGFTSDQVVGLGFMIFVAIIVWLYHALSLASARRATLGMRWAGIFATDLAGERLSFARASGRHFASWVSYYMVLIGFLMQPFTARRQTLHDLMSSTVILDRVPPAKVG